MAETKNASTEYNLPSQYAKLGSDDDTYADTGPPDENAVRNLRRKIEPWLCSLFQGEHLSLLVGNGLTTAACVVAGVECASMESDQFTTEWGEKIETAAKEVSHSAGRGDEGSIPFLVEIPIGSVSSFMPLPCHSCSRTTARLLEGGGVGDSQPPSATAARCPGSPSPASGVFARSSASDRPCRCDWRSAS